MIGGHMAKAMCGGELDGFCKGFGGIRPCPDHERVIMGNEDKAEANGSDVGKGKR
jgi:hypothetical protein